jgi:hypothetical protein
MFGMVRVGGLWVICGLQMYQSTINCRRCRVTYVALHVEPPPPLWHSHAGALAGNSLTALWVFLQLEDEHASPSMRRVLKGETQGYPGP